MRITASTLKKAPRGMLLVPVFAGKARRDIRRLGLNLGRLRIPEKVGERVYLARRGSGPDPVVLVSMGKRGECDIETIRRVGGSMMSAVREAEVSRATVDMSGLPAEFEPDSVGAMCEGLELASCQFDRHKSERRDKPQPGVTRGF